MATARSTRQRGDFTGQERERLAREQAAEITEAQKRVGVVNAIDQVIEADGVFDPTTGDVVEMPDGVNEAIEQVSYEENDDDEVIDVTAGPSSLRSMDAMQDLRDPTPQQKPKPMKPNPMEIQDVPDVLVAEDEYVTFRVNTDVEDMTFGADRPLNNFVRGRKYRGPRDLYNHLESRGIIYH